jgi:phytoene desaturase
MSLFVWYFGVEPPYDDVPHHTVMMGPRFGGCCTTYSTPSMLADDFSLYFYRPTATDPSMAPEGCDSFYVLSPVPNLDADIDWAEDRRTLSPQDRGPSRGDPAARPQGMW